LQANSARAIETTMGLAGRNRFIAPLGGADGSMAQ